MQSTLKPLEITTSKDITNKRTTLLQSELSKVFNFTLNSSHSIKITEQLSQPYTLSFITPNTTIEYSIIRYRSMQELRIKTDPTSLYHPQIYIKTENENISEFMNNFFDVKQEGNKIISFIEDNGFVFFRVYRFDVVRNEVMDCGPHLTLKLRRIVENGVVTKIK